MADGYLNFDTKINENGFNEGINKLGSLGKSGLSVVSKAMTGAVAAVGAGAAAIVKSSLGVVANMEQQVGGVETLFKDSAKTVIRNANNAFKTAQLSANDYMSTVTSFSASLTVNGATVTVGTDGTFTKDVTLAEGANTITIVAKDKAGKTTTVTRKVTVDTSAPVIKSVTLTPNPVDCGKTFIIAVEITD